METNNTNLQREAELREISTTIVDDILGKGTVYNRKTICEKYGITGDDLVEVTTLAKEALNKKKNDIAVNLIYL